MSDLWWLAELIYNQNRAHLDAVLDDAPPPSPAELAWLRRLWRGSTVDSLLSTEDDRCE